MGVTWYCPACRAEIGHSSLLMTESTRVVADVGKDRTYRCHVCRLELVIEAHTGTVRVAPFDPSEMARRGLDASF